MDKLVGFVQSVPIISHGKSVYLYLWQIISTKVPCNVVMFGTAMLMMSFVGTSKVC